MSNYLEQLRKKLAGANETVPANTLDETPIEATEGVQEESDTNVLTPIEVIKKAIPPIPGTGKLVVKDAEKRFYLTQTLIKEITTKHGYYRDDACPRAIYEKYMAKNPIMEVTTEPMQAGIYGETLILGGGARGKVVDGLSLNKKTNQKRKHQLNIEEQALRAPIWCLKKGISIHKGINTQVPIAKYFDPDKKIIVRTEIDLFPTPFIHNDNLEIAVMDLKFTGDIYSDFGDYSWGKPEFLDHLQADMTYWLLQDFDWELNVRLHPHKEEIYEAIFKNDVIIDAIQNEKIMFIYFVIGYIKQPLETQCAFVYRSYRENNGSLLRQNEWKERARKTLIQLSQWREKDWEPLPSNNCIKCPLAKANGGYCDKAINIQQV